MKGTAATIALGTALVLVGGGWTTGQPRGGPAPLETLALSNANLVDVRTGSVRPGVTVVLVGGRIESILMSLPPAVRWPYDYRPEPGSREAELYEVYLKPRDWADE